ncbi:type VI secretion system protein TssR domain-containing protein [Mucilaginibacter lacusdianchii]|uniref:type VI secretion system protein TssR domain-containing protein n=1 Tax=Mucilaginibacter lacusdianchii TaxID=2684211 RepID=UPI00131EBD9B|nr:type VI secretion system protein TssR domain-containing protein [Mucilaginibacter sp. JXJ CY 39]
MKSSITFFTILLTLAAHAQSPVSISKKVKTLPAAFEKPNAQTNIYDDGKTTSLPWIVFSDRDENFTYTAPGGSLVMKKIKFMEPFYVSKESNGYLKLIKYQPGMVQGRKLTNKKAAQSYGWISKNKVLLWQSAYVSKLSGYPQKAVTIVSDKGALLHPEVYYDKTDSLYVFNSPDLSQKKSKVALNQLLYVYKKSADGKTALVGSDNQLMPDSAANSVYGWIPADAVHSWGDRLYISTAKLGYNADDSAAAVINSSLKSSSPVAGQFAFDPLIDADQQLLRSLPVVSYPSTAQNGTMQVGLAADVYDKSNNTILNIKGGHITYKDYLALRKNMRNINVVFVVDGGSAMRNYFSGLTSTIQSFEKVFNAQNKGSLINYGAVVYRNASNCTTGGIEQQAFSTDYRQVVRFLDKQATVTAGCTAATNSQPVFEGIGASLNMFANRRNQSNLIVLIGSTGNGYYNNDNINELASRIASADARMLAIQVYSDYKPIYNDFVIQARKLVSESAVLAAERKKNRMVVGEGLSSSQQFNTSVSDSVSFYLDYPRNSLVQGAVVFPPKGVVKSNQAMETSLARLMSETQYDIKSQTHSLDSAFRLTGREHRYVSPLVLTQLTAPVPDNVGDDMPHNAFKYYLTADVPASMVTEHPQQLQYTLILSDAEYKQLQDVLSMMIGENLQQDAGNYRKKLFKNYLNILRKNMALDMSRSEIKNMKLADYIQKTTGLIPPANTALGNYRVIDLKRTGNMPQQPFEAYINYLIQSRNTIKQETLLRQHFISNGKTYYYVTQANWQ